MAQNQLSIWRKSLGSLTDSPTCWLAGWLKRIGLSFGRLFVTCATNLGASNALALAAGAVDDSQRAKPSCNESLFFQALRFSFDSSSLALVGSSRAAKIELIQGLQGFFFFLLVFFFFFLLLCLIVVIASIWPDDAIIIRFAQQKPFALLLVLRRVAKLSLCLLRGFSLSSFARSLA